MREPKVSAAPSSADVKVSAGARVSSVKPKLFGAVALPAASNAEKMKVCEPSAVHRARVRPAN
jgi:hypothetical protein